MIMETLTGFFSSQGAWRTYDHAGLSASLWAGMAAVVIRGGSLKSHKPAAAATPGHKGAKLPARSPRRMGCVFLLWKLEELRITYEQKSGRHLKCPSSSSHRGRLSPMHVPAPKPSVSLHCLRMQPDILSAASRSLRDSAPVCLCISAPASTHALGPQFVSLLSAVTFPGKVFPWANVLRGFPGATMTQHHKPSDFNRCCVQVYPLYKDTCPIGLG